MGIATFKPRNTQRAKGLRGTASPAERVPWRRLSERKVAGQKFSRRMPIGPYFADFLCREHRLVVEVDGYSHDRRGDEDARRDAFMAEAGYRVLRFANEEISERLEAVILQIAEAFADRLNAHPQPLPQAGGVK